MLGPMLASALKFIVDGTAELMMQPARFKILQYLRQSQGARYVDQIAKATGIHPRMVSHHLDVLEEEALVDSMYLLVNARDSKRKVAVRMCRATSKADKALDDIRESVTP